MVRSMIVVAFIGLLTPVVAARASEPAASEVAVVESSTPVGRLLERRPRRVIPEAMAQALHEAWPQLSEEDRRRLRDQARSIAVREGEVDVSRTEAIARLIHLVFELLDRRSETRQDLRQLERTLRHELTTLKEELRAVEREWRHQALRALDAHPGDSIGRALERRLRPLWNW